MITDYSSALDFVLDHEGRVTENVPGDHGGLTRWGILHGESDAYRRTHGLPPLSIDKIPAEQWQTEVQAIYRRQYWDTCHCSDMPLRVAGVVFDAAVNVGVSRSVKWLQKTLGVTVDGVVGLNTLAALKHYVELHGESALISALMERRRAFYTSIGVGTQRKFLKGWMARVEDLRRSIGG